MNAPERIWATTGAAQGSLGYGQGATVALHWVGVWSEKHDDMRQVEYRRADLPPTLAEALALPEIAALVEAAEGYRRAIAAFDGGGEMTGKIARMQSWRDALDAALTAIKKDPR